MAEPPARLGKPPTLTDVPTPAAEYAAAEKAPATRLAYRSDWGNFVAWCASVGAETLPALPGAVASYLAYLADSGLKSSTISRRLAAIAYAHQLSGCGSPTSAEAVHAVLRGIRRTLGTAPDRKTAATAQLIARLTDPNSYEIKQSNRLAELRDRALILLGFAAALRRSELVALTVADLERAADGLVLHIRRSKTDQEGAGDTIAVPHGAALRPVEALDAWLDAAVILEGPLFRPIAKGGRIGARALSASAVAVIVKRRAEAAGLDPTLFAGHSLRAGFVTSALEHGADILRVMDVTRHKRVETLRVYDRRARAFRDHAGKDFL